MINLQSLSLTSAFSGIISYFKSQENSGFWKDLTNTGSETSFLIRLLANIFSTISYRVVSQSRENYLSTAILPSSNVGISVNLGYSAFRGSNLKRRVTLNPTGNFTIPKLSSLGAYDDSHEIFALEEVALEEGVPIEIDTVVGKIKEETFVTGTSAARCFSLFTTKISEDYVLYLGSQEVPTTKIIKEMTEDKYLVRTNPYLSVDIMYLNTYPNAKYTYGTGSEITIRYIELEDVNVIPYADYMFVNYGTLLDVTNISSYLPFETVDSMKVNAPLDHETQNLIRSKQDYANRLQQIVPAIIDADYLALTPTYTLISGLKNDFTLLTDIEKEKVTELLKKENYFGTPLPDITHPRREVANLLIQLALNTKYKNIADIDIDVQNILKSFYDARLGSTFNTYDLERKIESLSYVKYARVSHVINDRQAGMNYQVGYILNYENENYIVSKILGVSGTSKPNWNIPMTAPSQIDTGLETSDGSLIWRAFKLLPNMPSSNFFVWSPNTQYGLGDYVTDEANAPGYMFKCVDLVKSSGFAEPDMSMAEAGDFFVDGGVVWVAKDRSDSYNVWSASTNYRLGDSVNTTSGPDLSLECVSYTGTVSAEEDIVFESPSYPVIAQTSNTFTIAGYNTYYFRVGDIITGTHAGGTTTFVVSSAIYNGENTIVTVTSEISSGIEYIELFTTQRGTRDGQILWTLVDDINNIKYPWNGYVVFDHQLEILE